MKAIKTETGMNLLDLHPDQELWASWLGQASTLHQALPSSFQAASGLNVQKLENDSEQTINFPPSYAADLIQDLEIFTDDVDERYLLAQSISDLVSGKVRSVVTGQQPGFAGGPLYSLYKIATAVALARRHTREGQPTVPVFWMGDDDDDWQELLDPVFWDEQGGLLKSSSLQGGTREKRSSMIGSIDFSPLEETTAQVLSCMENAEGLGESLQAACVRAQKENISLSTFTERILRMVFKGCALVIVRGNDPRLHRHCGDFYQQAIEHLPVITRRVGEQGQLLKTTGIEPLSANSLKRPLYLADGNSRQPWDGGNLPQDPSGWRCGVLLRSLLQDWLLQPAAVVVGPGELAYLAQIVPAYEIMGLERSPLVPRLFGWMIPDDLSVDIINKFTCDRPLGNARIDELAQVAGAAGEEKLVGILMEELGLDTERAKQLAAGRTRRWVKGVNALLKNESQKQFELNRPLSPQWVFPQGKRQERKLAWIPMAAALGFPLIDAVLDACRKHLSAGAEGHWNEYLFRVPHFENRKGQVS